MLYSFFCFNLCLALQAIVRDDSSLQSPGVQKCPEMYDCGACTHNVCLEKETSIYNGPTDRYNRPVYMTYDMELGTTEKKVDSKTFAGWSTGTSLLNTSVMMQSNGLNYNCERSADMNEMKFAWLGCRYVTATSCIEHYEYRGGTYYQCFIDKKKRINRRTSDWKSWLKDVLKRTPSQYDFEAGCDYECTGMADEDGDRLRKIELLHHSRHPHLSSQI